MTKKKYRLARHYTQLGDFLHFARTKAGLTQKQISDDLKYSSAQFISNFERGICAPPRKKLKVLIKKLSLDQESTVRFLLAGERSKILSQLTR